MKYERADGGTDVSAGFGDMDIGPDPSLPLAYLGCIMYVLRSFIGR